MPIIATMVEHAKISILFTMDSALPPRIKNQKMFIFTFQVVNLHMLPKVDYSF